jgi:histone chaperone ASF1
MGEARESTNRKEQPIKMSIISLSSIKVIDKEAHFLDDFKFDITFSAVEPLSDDLEWKLIYLASANDKSLEQELDSILLGPVVKGVNKFVFQVGSKNH